MQFLLNERRCIREQSYSTPSNFDRSLPRTNTQTHKLVRPSKCLQECVCVRWSVLAKGCPQLDAYWAPGCWRVLVLGGLEGSGGAGLRWSCLCFQPGMAKVQHEQVIVRQLDRRRAVVSSPRCLLHSAAELRSTWMVFNSASSLGGGGWNRIQLAPPADRNKWLKKMRVDCNSAHIRTFDFNIFFLLL